MYLSLIAVTVLVLAYALARTWRGSIEFLPTIGWMFLMAIPFLIEYPLFHPIARDTQSLYLSYTGAMLFAGDMIGARFMRRDIPARTPAKIDMTLPYAMALVFFVLSFWHLFTAPGIPLFTMLKGTENEVVMAHIRNVFSRDSGSMLLRYASSLSICILAMPAVLILARKGRWHILAALTVFGWMTFYAVAGTAKSPLAMALLIGAAGLVIMARPSRARLLLRGMMGLGLVGLVALCALDMFSPYDALLKNLPEKYASHAQNPPQALHDNLGDYARARAYRPGEVTPWAWRKVDYSLYRIFFTPMEVSERWYEYAYEFPPKHIQFSRLIDDSRTNTQIHPANAVGLWAFYAKYPNNYTPEVYAYASIDADAALRYGWAGMAIAGLLLLAYRVLIVAVNDRAAFTGGAFYAAALGLLAYLPSAASIQAMMLPQGLILLPAAMIAVRMREKYWA